MANNNLISVNANEGITNIVNDKEIRKTMINTFLELAKVLEGHCGPFSGTAVLYNPSNPMAEPIFTKDGINILSSIKYASAIQDFARMQLAYMGSRIERGAGDGTTSAMIVMAYAIAYLLEFLHKTKYRYTVDELSIMWSRLVEKVEEHYKQFEDKAKKLTPDQIKYIAASQSYTSSHGDKKLAECIGELFARTPREVWDTLVVQKASYESEKKYEVTIHKAQYTIDDVILFPMNRRKKELGTELKINQANVLIRNFLTKGDDSQQFIHDYITQCIQDGTQLLVVTCNDMDTVTRNYYSELFTENPDHRVIFVLVQFEDGALNDINAIDMIRSQKDGPLDMTKLNLLTADIECESGSFRFLNGLFKDNGTGLNPYYKNANYPVFNRYIEQIQQIIEKEKSDISRRNTKAIEKFYRILHKLLSTQDVTFTVGGAAYDNAAGQDIAMDALLATKCALTKGYVCGRFATLKDLLQSLCFEWAPSCRMCYGDKYGAIANAYLDALILGITKVNDALVDSLPRYARKRVPKKCSPADYLKLDNPSYGVPKSIEGAMKTHDYCVLQPAMTDITFMKRFGEVGLKFLKANRVIMSGLYNVTKEK